jgi:hypothetical protein
MRIYFYKLSVDNGGAPHIMKGLLSLAICKPMIRCSAQVGDLIFDFAADTLHTDNRLIYAAQITGKVLNGDYYRSRTYRSRGDCVYNWDGTAFAWRDGSLYHGPKNMTRDLGRHPDYQRAHVLLSSDFRYFGKNGTDSYKTSFSTIKEAVEALKQGHRVKHTNELKGELLDLKDELWKTTVQGLTTTLPKRAGLKRGCK